mmetsp:Transcript_27372/g.57937  ORF Transcript_27372/g.57937 Transcript_27372/m.57937 type:complete len:247 (+) Transcript_27372:139-879(+)
MMRSQRRKLAQVFTPSLSSSKEILPSLSLSIRLQSSRICAKAACCSASRIIAAFLVSPSRAVEAVSTITAVMRFMTPSTIVIIKHTKIAAVQGASLTNGQERSLQPSPVTIWKNVRLEFRIEAKASPHQLHVSNLSSRPGVIGCKCSTATIDQIVSSRNMRTPAQINVFNVPTRPATRNQSSLKLMSNRAARRSLMVRNVRRKPTLVPPKTSPTIPHVMISKSKTFQIRWKKRLPSATKRSKASMQ